MAAADQGAKLQALLNAALVPVKTEIMNNSHANTQEILLGQAALMARMDVIEGLVAKEKKTPARKDAATLAEGKETDATAAANDKFPTNVLLFFRQKFTTDPAFRDEFFTPEIKETVSKIEGIDKKKPDAKLTAEANGCWNEIKAKPDGPAHRRVRLLFDNAKKEHDAAQKPNQMAAEPEV